MAMRISGDDAIQKPVLIGRSSSHFTRTVRMFAAACRVDCEFQILRDLKSAQAQDYGGNPALRIPVLVTNEGRYFGALNCCRVMQRLSTDELQIIWPEELMSPLLASAQELINQGMADEVTLIMGGYLCGAPCPSALRKALTSLAGILDWLEARIEELLDSMPMRDLSFIEVALFCFIEHLAFRHVTAMNPYARLTHFATRFGERMECRLTAYRFD